MNLKIEVSNVRRLIWLFLIIAIFTAVPVFAQGENPPINAGEVSAVRVMAIIAGALSLLFDYFPGLAQKFDALEEGTKQLISLGLAVVLVVAAYLLTCFSVITSSLVCTPAGGWDAAYSVIYVIAVQYGFHKATKPTVNFKAKSYLKIPPNGKNFTVNEKTSKRA